MGFRISGTVRDLDSGTAVPGVKVVAKDRDLFFDDLLGRSSSGDDGAFDIEVAEGAGRDLFADRPDVYLEVQTEGGVTLATTKEEILFDTESSVQIDVNVPHAALVDAGMAELKPAGWMEDLDQARLKMFKTWTWREEAGDETAGRLVKDLAARSSVLELMKCYIDELKGSADNDAEPFGKLARLFELGITPDSMEGHFFGVPVGIRTGDLEGGAAQIGNVLGFLWGTAMQHQSPWVGKSFQTMRPDKTDDLTENALPAGTGGFMGINHFNRIDLKPLNVASFHLLNLWMGLKPTSKAERVLYGNERDGGNFVAYKTRSIYHKTERDVFLLNYRWPKLNNPPPFCWLIDEMVKVAEGMYLGQLIYATARLHRDYDPKVTLADNRYQHFGYFLLWDERWNPEARRLFAHLEMPVTAPGLRPVESGAERLGKYDSFTFESALPPNADHEVMSSVYEDMLQKPTILHLLKSYSDELQENFDNKSPSFLKLREIFNRGIGIGQLDGFFRGALVSWHSQGLFDVFDLNTLNLAWMRIGRSLSTWTGKTFEPVSQTKLKEFTDGFETGEVPTFWGSNTQALRTENERFAGKLMKLAGIWSERVPADEARELGYDLKNFFFVAKRTKSVNPHNAGKDILQFNYRWPKLKTIAPDCFCLDEIVQIAEGLYLGQLMYATNLLKPYSPTTDPAQYKYRHFGYFLLMDDDWHSVRLDLGFDLDNV